MRFLLIARLAVAAAVAAALRPPARRAVRMDVVEGFAGASRLIGEGVLPADVPPEPAPLNAVSVFAAALVAAAAAAVYVARAFEPNPDARALLDGGAPATLFRDAAPYYVVRWRVAKTTTYEGLDSRAEVAEGGADNSARCSSLAEANALSRRLAKQLPGLATRTFKITGAAVVALAPGGGADAAAAEDAWVGDYSDVVRAAVDDRRAAPVVPPQQVWDDLLQADAEAEAEAARTDVDRAWSEYLASLRVTEELDVTVIGGEGGAAPCRLCNGKGVRVLFKQEVPCEWCGGSGIAQD